MEWQGISVFGYAGIFENRQSSNNENINENGGNGTDETNVGQGENLNENLGNGDLNTPITATVDDKTNFYDEWFSSSGYSQGGKLRPKIDNALSKMYTSPIKLDSNTNIQWATESWFAKYSEATELYYNSERYRVVSTNGIRFITFKYNITNIVFFITGE